MSPATSRIATMLAPRRAAGLLAISALAVLATAWGFEHIGGYAPCPLCIYQRYPWWAAFVLALLIFVFGRRSGKRLAGAGFAAAALTLAANGALAGYHVLVEQGILDRPPMCGTQGISLEGDPSEVRAAIMDTQPVACDEVVWQLAGLSMAGYNGLLSLAAAGVAGAAAWVAWRHL